MSLRARTILAVAALLLIALVIVGAIGRAFLLENFTNLERDGMARDVDRALTALEASAADLRNTSADYALWDDMAAFAASPSQAFIDNNLPLRVFQDLSLDTVIVFNAQGEIVFQRAVDFERRELASVPDAARESLLAQTSEAIPDSEDVVAGIGITPLNPVLVTRRPIRASDGQGPNLGEIIIVRRLNAFELDRLATTTRLRLELTPLETSNGPATPSPTLDSGAALSLGPIERLMGLGPTYYKSALTSGDIRVFPLDDRTLVGEVTLGDLAGRPVLNLRVLAGREIYQQGQRTVLLFIVGVLAVGLFSGFIGLQVIEQLTLRPLDRLTHEVGRIATTGNASLRVSTASGLELERVSVGVNRMLDTLETAQRELATTRDAAIEAARLKTRLFASVSHDLRTPINAVIGFAEMLGEGVYGPLSDEQARALKRIDRNARELLLQVNDLLEAASLEAGQLPVRPTYFTTAEWLGALRDTGAALVGGKGLAFVIEDETGGRKLYGDPERLHQITLNLVHNAVKFTERGEVRVRIVCAPEHWVLTVSDTGSGIAPELQAAIFEPFRQGSPTTTGKQTGVGLGLFIARELAQRMGGTLTVTSRSGQGSAFTLTVPQSTHNGKLS